MMLLNTKIQHKNFEPGEFIEEKPRTYAETIDVINNFPWEVEREHIQISLTNPSITIEADPNNFLKFALFYNGKFVLHYFNWHQELYTKSFYHKEDAYIYIKKFYESEVFDLADFRKENTWLQHNLVHFVSQDFHYTITQERVWKYLFHTSGINFAVAIIFLSIPLFAKGTNFHPIAVSIIILIYCILWGGGLNLLLFFNYYFFARHKILIMSKGNNIFYYGDIDNPLKYDKKDILQVTKYQGGSDRNPVSGFAYIKIDFWDSTSISIPNLFVSENALQNKLSECPQKDKVKFPWIKNA